MYPTSWHTANGASNISLTGSHPVSVSFASNQVIRSYVNCYPPQIGGNFHQDDGDHTYLFFPDESENIEKLGDLQFKDGPTVSYKTNRLVVFDAKLHHRADQNLTNQLRHTIAWKTLI